MSVEMSVQPENCPLGTKNAVEIENLKAYIDTKFKVTDDDISALFKKMDAILLEIREIREKYSDRLPVWATFAMTGMGTVIGILVTVIVGLLGRS